MLLSSQSRSVLMYEMYELDPASTSHGHGKQSVGIENLSLGHLRLKCCVLLGTPRTPCSLPRTPRIRGQALDLAVMLV